MPRIEVRIKDNLRDVNGEKTKKKIEEELKIRIKEVRIVDSYNIEEELSREELEKIGKEVFSDQVIQEYSIDKPFFRQLLKIEVGYLPGVTDNVGATAKDGIRDALGKEIQVYSTKVYAIDGNELNWDKCRRITDLLHNRLVQKAIVHESDKEVKPYLPKVILKHEPRIDEFDLSSMENEELQALSKNRLLALNLMEMKRVKKYFERKQNIDGRKRIGLGSKPTDVELEVLAQTWSEHCKHKIFNAYIQYSEEGEPHAIDSLFKTFIKGATERTKKPYVLSVFEDNGGIIKFDDSTDVAIKVETHNAPSALDPYGGALTGILGVNRDVIGCGLGAKPIGNVNMLCFGYPDEKSIPEGVLHPKRIMEGVVKGIEDGGNCSGIPTINGSITFERAYTARPVVYCGTVGVMPSQIQGRNTSKKKIEPGYLAIMVGGRIGKDGIHGATFSSQRINEHTPQSVVQIGDPFTQKKVLDFVLEARDNRLYDAITDNGAGGLSSSIGEMASICGGCEIYLEKAPLKYEGLDPWEILISESQERMSLATHPDNLEALEKIARKHDVELTVIGKFTRAKKFHALYNGKTVAFLDMRFLHEGVPQLKLRAAWKRRKFDEPNITETDLGKILRLLLSAPDITSKEKVVRRYDHEVQGGSVIKPVVEGPNDAAVLRPILNSQSGIVIGHGICPRYVQDGYEMAMMAFDEGVRNVLASGAKFGYLACLDNFSWPDPIMTSKNPDGDYKLGQLVRACLGLFKCSTEYKIPIISGKDSMKNDYHVKNEKYSIPPTLLVTVIGKIDDVKHALSVDFKQPGDYVYAIGVTREELGGSEYYKLFNGIGDSNPKVKPRELVPIYKAFSEAVEEGLLRSAHDISDGGLAVAIAECSIAGGYGVDVDMRNIQRETENEDAILFSESAGRFIVTVKEKNVQKFEKLMGKLPIGRIGRVRGDKRFVIRGGERILINEDLFNLKESWSTGLKF